MDDSLSDLALALSCPTRLAILHTVEPDLPFSELARRVGVSRATLSYHVNVLQDVGLVVVSSDGARKSLRLKYEEIRLRL